MAMGEKRESQDLMVMLLLALLQGSTTNEKTEKRLANTSTKKKSENENTENLACLS